MWQWAPPALLKQNYEPKLKSVMKRKSPSLITEEHLQVSGGVSAHPLWWTGMLTQATQASSQNIYAGVCDI